LDCEVTRGGPDSIMGIHASDGDYDVKMFGKTAQKPFRTRGSVAVSMKHR
jgi:hypothetical protein